MKKRVLVGGVAIPILTAALLRLFLPTRIEIKKRFVVSGPRAKNPLYVAVFGRMPAEHFETLVASNANWVNQVDESIVTDDSPSILYLCAELGLTNHVKILIQHGANVDDAIAYGAKYGRTDRVALIKYCQQSLDGRK
jgi:hypothetical protein